MTEQEKSELWKLRAAWLGAYQVSLVDGVWRAKRCDGVTDVLTADSADELAGQIRSDYGAGLLDGSL
jgi:hypothetical protein